MIKKCFGNYGKKQRRCLKQKPFMKKTIFIAVALLSGSIVFAQKKNLKPPPPPPPPPKVADVNKLPPPPSPPMVSAQQNSLPADYKAFLKRNPGVKHIDWSENNRVHIYLKSGSEEVYDLNKEEDVKKVESRYGQLPAPPPPPPAVPKLPEVQ